MITVLITTSKPGAGFVRNQLLAKLDTTLLYNCDTDINMNYSSLSQTATAQNVVVNASSPSLNSVTELGYWSYNDKGMVIDTLCFGVSDSVLSGFLSYNGTCTNTSIEFSANASIGTYYYSWSFPDGSPSSSNLEFPVIQYDSAGMYGYSVVISNGFDSLHIQDTIVVGDPIDVDLLTLYSVCSGDTLELFFNSVIDIIPLSPTLLADSNMLSLIGLNSGTKYLTFIDTNGCQIDTSFYEIVIPGTPVVLGVNTNDSIYVVNASDYTSFQWYNDSIAMTGEVGTSIPIGTGSFYVCAEDTNGCTNCSEVLTNAPTNGSFNHGQVCINTDISFSATSNPEAVGLSWTFVGGSPSSSSSSSVDVNYSAPGVYPVELIVYGLMDSAIIYDTITVNPMMNNYVDSMYNVCEGDTILINALYSNNCFSYSYGSGYIQSNCTGEIYPTSSYSHPYTYYDSTGCFYEDTIIFNVSTQPNIGINANYLKCPDDTLTLIGQNIDSSWITPSTSVFQINDYSYDVFTSTSNQYVLYYIDTIGCEYDQNIQIDVYQNLGIGGFYTKCAEDTLSLFNLYSDSCWISPFVDVIQTSQCSFEIFNDTDNTYDITYYDLNGCRQVENLIIENSPTTSQLLFGGTTMLMQPNNFSDIQWYLDSIPIPGANSTAVSVLSGGSYYFCGDDFNGCYHCSDTMNISFSNISIEGELDFIIYPNPNRGDFNVHSSKSGKLSLFSAEGKLIQQFQLQSENNQINADNVPPGTYFLLFEHEAGIINRKLILHK